MDIANHMPLDEVRAILRLFQRDAKHSTAVEISEALGVSDGTVRNRIEKLERSGGTEGYVPLINYKATGYQLEAWVMCSAPMADWEQLANEALHFNGTIFEAADEIGASAIAYRSRGGSRIMQFLSGELSLKLVTNANRPIIALPHIDSDR